LAECNGFTWGNIPGVDRLKDVMENQPLFLIVMGVSGCGKTTIGKMLATRLGWDFYDADEYHPAENIEKMAAGIPLTDADREPWLENLRYIITRSIAEKQSGVLACSALKKLYRNRLASEDAEVRFVYLKGTYDLIWSRMSTRSGHYMKPILLQSQFETLEEPDGAITVGIDKTPEEICDEVISRL
jgi:gluconokinase